ncbi:uncharacterized protein LOC131638757 [Vicia villosa]|uniref:uncharacterized protein LOC131638757 n=1 Tax=Vicia villosa TaxID=3911 RepID=UPI00273C9C67|nr:uncharacterized protein LOC131638757 [Vicia villosa]
MIVNGEIKVNIEEQDVISEKKNFLKNALIMYAIEEDLSMNAVKKFMLSTWNFVTLPDLYYNKEGYFLIRFKNGEDKARGERSIGKIANDIRKPMLTDECTTKKLRVSYARVLIEVDVTKELKSQITIRDPAGEKMNQQVEYEWKPSFCTLCNKVGHRCKQKTEKATQVYVKKQQTTSNDATIITKPGGQQEDEGKGVEEEDLWIKAKTAKGSIKKLDAERLEPTSEIIRIWLGWDHRVYDIKIIGTSDQYLHSEVYQGNGEFSHYLTAIYAHNQLTHKKKLWDDLQILGDMINKPWIIIGDFNNVLKTEDRMGGNEVQESEYRDLENLMEVNGVFEHETKGSYFTWSIKHIQGMIYSRIDRALYNNMWFTKFPESVIEVLNPHISDHSPLKVTLDRDRVFSRQRKRFQFLNCVIEKPEYMDTLKNN